MKKPLNFPAKSAQEDPEAWAQFWRDYKNIRSTMNVEDRREYDRKRNAEVTRKRQIRKLEELMAKYPDEVTRLLGR